MPDTVAPIDIRVPDKVETLLRELDELERDLNVRELMPQLLALVAEVRKALADGSLSMWEIFRLGQRFVRLVKTAQRR